jgi:hypothetical protein
MADGMPDLTGLDRYLPGVSRQIRQHGRIVIPRNLLAMHRSLKLAAKRFEWLNDKLNELIEAGAIFEPGELAE